MRLPPFALVVLLALVGSGCGVTARVRTAAGRVETRTVRGSGVAALRRASNEIPCAIDDLVLQDIGSGGYRVNGCGTQITYTCAGEICAPSERTSMVDAPPPQRIATTAPALRQRRTDAHRRPGTWSDDEVRQLLSTVHDLVIACLPPEMSEVRVSFALSPVGRVRLVTRNALPLESNACIDAILERGRMSGRVTGFRFVWLRFRRGASVATQTIETAPTVDTPAEPETSEPGAVAPLPPTLEASVRAAVDARALAILACVDDTALAMQVSWTREGRLDALLRGDRQGTPEEACVRAIVQGITVATPGAPGTIVHAVQR